MKPPPFAYMRPDTLDQALECLAGDPDAVPLSGGQSLVPLLNLRLARPSTVIDISGLSGMSDVGVETEAITVGALVTHARLAAHAWQSGMEALPEGVDLIGYQAIRHRGTLGGSIAHADPAAELPSIAVALDAVVGLTSSRGTRRVPADDFFVGYYDTVREHDELVTSVTFPLHGGMRSGFAEFSRRTGDFAIALAAVAAWDTDGGAEARVVVGGLDVRPRRIPELESALVDDETGWVEMITPDLLASHTAPSSDIHGSADFRLEVAAEMVRRAAGRLEAA